MFIMYILTNLFYGQKSHFIYNFITLYIILDPVIATENAVLWMLLIETNKKLFLLLFQVYGQLGFQGIISGYVCVYVCIGLIL